MAMRRIVELVLNLKRYLLIACFTTLAFDALADRSELQMVTFDLPPYAYERDNKPQGLTVAIVEQLMRRAGVDHTQELLPAKRALLYTLKTDDACVFPIERSQEREVQLYWISPISIARHGLYRANNRTLPRITVLEDAIDMRIGSFLGSAMGDYLTSLGFVVDVAATSQANIHKLKADRIDLWASDTLSAPYLAKLKNYTLPEPELVFFTTLGAIGCNLSVPRRTINRLSETLKTMYRDGTVSSITARYTAAPD